MKPVRILLSGIFGGIWLLAMTYIADSIAVVVAPYNIFDIGGMRPPDDPIMLLYFIYPFLFAIIAAFVYGLVKGSFTGSREKRGISYGIVLILLVLVPDMIVIFSSMTYPAGFYFEHFLRDYRLSGSRINYCIPGRMTKKTLF